MLLLAAAGGQEDYFREHVQPILQKHCLQCHNHELDDGGISFEDRATLLRNGPGGSPAVVPGAPAKSLLVRAIRHQGDIQMPPGEKLAQKDIDRLIRWIKLGAPWSAHGPAPKR
jgi:cytochrome c551/c552